MVKRDPLVFLVTPLTPPGEPTCVTQMCLFVLKSGQDLMQVGLIPEKTIFLDAREGTPRNVKYITSFMCQKTSYCWLDLENPKRLFD